LDFGVLGVWGFRGLGFWVEFGLDSTAVCFSSSFNYNGEDNDIDKDVCVSYCLKSIKTFFVLLLVQICCL